MKDFTLWNQVKAELEERNIPVDFREREIWFCSLGLNLGHEQDGKHERSLRPVIVVKKFNNDIFWGVPLSHVQKTGLYYHPIVWDNNNSSAIISQLRLLDQKRLFRKIGIVSREEFMDIKIKAIKLLL